MGAHDYRIASAERRTAAILTPCLPLSELSDGSTTARIVWSQPIRRAAGRRLRYRANIVAFLSELHRNGLSVFSPEATWRLQALDTRLERRLATVAKSCNEELGDGIRGVSNVIAWGSVQNAGTNSGENERSRRHVGLTDRNSRCLWSNSGKPGHHQDSSRALYL